MSQPGHLTITASDDSQSPRLGAASTSPATPSPGKTLVRPATTPTQPVPEPAVSAPAPSSPTKANTPIEGSPSSEDSSSTPSESASSSAQTSRSTAESELTSAERVITKILPQDRLITFTDSTGGVVTQTGFALPPPPARTGQLSTGSIVGLVIGILAFLSFIAAALFILARRRRKNRRNRKQLSTITTQNDVEDHRSSPEPTIYPFAYFHSPATASGESSWNATSIAPVSAQRFEKSLVALAPNVRHSTSVGPDYVGSPPPAYRDRLTVIA